MVVATTGFFDGLHKGHQKVLDCLCSTARKNGQKSAVVTFWPHPRAVLQKNAESFRLLTSLEEKQDLIRAFGVDDLYVVSFTKEFSKLSAREFIKEYLIDKYNVDIIAIGNGNSKMIVDPAGSVKDTMPNRRTDIFFKTVGA